MPADRRRLAAIAFIAAGLIGTVVFGAGRFGADVGAVVIFPVAAAIAMAIVLQRPRLAWLGGGVPFISLLLGYIWDMRSRGSAD